MTDLPALAERIHGILVRAKIGFTPSQDGLEFFVPIRDGTAAVMVRPGSFGDEPLVLFQSPVLQGVRFEEAGARALAAINLRNCSLLVGRLSYYEEDRSEEHTSELQSRRDLVCRLLLEKKKK